MEVKNDEIVFVNGKRAACGCRVIYSDGHGEYSNVVTVHLCDIHRGQKVG